MKGDYERTCLSFSPEILSVRRSDNNMLLFFLGNVIQESEGLSFMSLESLENFLCIIIPHFKEPWL